ncbi:MAG: amidoligase family protein [Pseudomonadales bacterium]
MQQKQAHLPMESKSDGTIRQVGFEIEFSGLTFDQCIEIVADKLGDKVSRRSHIEAIITNNALGDFTLELDWQFLKDQARETGSDNEFIKVIAELAGTVVPLELVCPPIAVNEISALDDTIDALRSAGAKGTDDSFLYAFGVHINTDIPDLEAETITRYLKAYCVLQDYLVQAHSVNTMRRIFPYVDLYKEPYIRQVLTYETPGIGELITDYLNHNPTRNRAFDMLPIFACIDEKRIQKELDDPRIKSRPAFHYRMPNCHIEQPSWSLQTDWKIWCQLEMLADDSTALNEVTNEYRQRLKAGQFITDSNWAQYIQNWMTSYIHGS